MSVNAREEEYEHVELFGKPALFTNSRIDRFTVPKGFSCYDLRGSDYDPGKPVTVENQVGVNHAGAVLTPAPVTIPKAGYRRLQGKLNFLGESMSLAEFCEEHSITLAPDEPKFTLRPASPDEAGLFFAPPKEQDAELGAIGHVRIDFGSGGKEFWHTWWPRGEEALNSPEFKDELAELVNELRETGPLKDLSAMHSYCAGHHGEIGGGWRQNYGYMIETERYRYCLRCSPGQGDYHAYLTAFDMQVQKMNMVEQDTPEQGMEMGGM
ncbi:LPD28 domain-containing protein [Hydrogenoanaerobacterium sp.]|uniref:LPD28 domain-containing protein n=1 Tax=Hydrogenoanaerobacterium sp. TaxID=2953763 RepID=UPI00289FAC18|nr:LPD28 domain-containing protein [Hydrogenoanaerobacterium sp.]